jgi:hypothetical protein
LWLLLSCSGWLLPSSAATYDMLEQPAHLLNERLGGLGLSGDLLIVRPRGVPHPSPLLYILRSTRLAGERIFTIHRGSVVHLGDLGVSRCIRQHLRVVGL